MAPTFTGLMLAAPKEYIMVLGGLAMLRVLQGAFVASPSGAASSPSARSSACASRWPTWASSTSAPPSGAWWPASGGIVADGKRDFQALANAN